MSRSGSGGGDDGRAGAVTSSAASSRSGVTPSFRAGSVSWSSVTVSRLMTVLPLVPIAVVGRVSAGWPRPTVNATFVPGPQHVLLFSRQLVQEPTHLALSLALQSAILRRSRQVLQSVKLLGREVAGAARPAIVVGQSASNDGEDPGAKRGTPALRAAAQPRLAKHFCGEIFSLDPRREPTREVSVDGRQMALVQQGEAVRVAPARELTVRRFCCSVPECAEPEPKARVHTSITRPLRAINFMQVVVAHGGFGTRRISRAAPLDRVTTT
jgi:hypothetical protein